MAKKFTSDEIFETATSTNGMKKRDAVSFHLYNPNGAVKHLPEFEEFVHNELFFTGCQILYGRHDNYHAKELIKISRDISNHTWWQVNYHVSGILEDAEKAKVVLATKRVKYSD